MIVRLHYVAEMSCVSSAFCHHSSLSRHHPPLHRLSFCVHAVTKKNKSRQPAPEGQTHFFFSYAVATFLQTTVSLQSSCWPSCLSVSLVSVCNAREETPPMKVRVRESRKARFAASRLSSDALRLGRIWRKIVRISWNRLSAPSSGVA